MTRYYFVFLLFFFMDIGYSNEIRFVGFRTVQLEDPVSQKLMKAAIFYPSETAITPTEIGMIKLDAARDIPIKMGRYPLVLFSHGNGGGLFSHHDFAIFLAKNNYLVAMIEHPEDNFRDSSGLGTDRVWIGRNLQMSALLDYLLQDALLADNIDTNKIGVAGFSAGAYTALLMLGAKPNFALLLNYCQTLPTSVLCEQTDILLSKPPLIAKGDQRIRAAFVMSPVAAFFDQQGLSEVVKPVYLTAAEKDTVIPLQYNAAHIKSILSSLVQYTVIPNADHFVFLSPCTTVMRSEMPSICTDSVNVNRNKVHEFINQEALNFFNDQFKK